MTDVEGALVLDTGPLSHLAQSGWLGVLRSVAGERQVVITDAVEAERRMGLPGRPHLQMVLDSDWIVVERLESPSEISAFADVAARLVVGDRNVGEASVLAYARVHRATAVVDDGAARTAAQEMRIARKGTLALLCDAIRGGLLTIDLVSDIADHLLATTYRLPFAPGGFERWASEQGLV
ncbi:hypothetical protein [Tsukamurella soli]|uniref:PIN domain-containing protein n=1 Tax=Tsukamurella soli TaxID=644556 RepID=A0ABP8JLR6_9ACTN